MGYRIKKNINKLTNIKKYIQVEMKDLIVGRRMASMNASAMMTATYGKVSNL